MVFATLARSCLPPLAKSFIGFLLFCLAFCDFYSRHILCVELLHSKVKNHSVRFTPTMMENELAQLSINEEEEEVIQIQPDLNRERTGEIFQLVGCFLTASIIHFLAMKITIANLWYPIRGV